MVGRGEGTLTPRGMGWDGGEGRAGMGRGGMGGQGGGGPTPLPTARRRAKITRRLSYTCSV